MSRTELSTNGTDLKRLTDKQRAFCHEYLIDYNAVRAARAAGYAHPNAAGGKLIANPLIAKVIGKAQRDNLDRLELTRERVVEELACIAMRDPIDLCDEDGSIIVDDLRKLPKHIRRCIDSIKCRQRTDAGGNITQEIELKLAPKTPALELAMKHFGMLAAEKRELSVKTFVDWDALWQPAAPEDDAIEGRIAGARLHREI